MKSLFFIAAIFLPMAGFSQDTISLQRCLYEAALHQPRQNDFLLLDSISNNSLKNIQNSWYPSFEVNGKATYQSDVINIGNIAIPGFDFPTPSKDQYRLSMDVKQIIFDAGVTKNKKEIEAVGNQSSKKELENVLRSNKEIVKNLFYSILNLQENIRILRLSIAELNANEQVLSAGFKAGTILQSDLQLLKLEKLNLEQQLASVSSFKKSSIAVLESNTGLQISSADSFILSSFTLPEAEEIDRIEMEILDLNIQKLNMTSNLSKSTRSPVLFAFGQLGYGNPGLNMLKDEFEPYYLAGAGLTWNIWDWNSSKRERANIDMRVKMLEHQKTDFTNRVNEALISQLSEIHSHQSAIEKIQEMLVLRVEITETYRSMMENGSIKTIDYLKVLNDERRTRMQLKTEEVLVQKAIADYKFISGKL